MRPLAFPSPTIPMDDERQVLLGYLDFFRSVVVSKVDGLPAEQSHGSVLPSGWTPAGLLKHLEHVELRWLEWGFEGLDVPHPWGDSKDGAWHATEPLTDLVAALAARAETTRRIVEAHDLDDVGRPGARWDGDPPPPLRRVLLHLLQEYARHAGHLDIVRELADGSTGEGGG